MNKLFSVISYTKCTDYVFKICFLGIKFSLKFFNFSYFIRSKFFKYNIVSLGGYCMPRVLTTSFCLKPQKKYGEKTCPFDLSLFDNIDKITELINNNFSNFFEKCVYENESQRWINPDLNAIFIHDHNPDSKKFKNTYERRIKNFYDYLKSKKRIPICVYSNRFPVTVNQIKNLYNAIKNVRNDKFYMVVINSSKEDLPEIENITVINGIDYEKISPGTNWAEAVLDKSPKAVEYADIVIPKIKNIIDEL